MMRTVEQDEVCACDWCRSWMFPGEVVWECPSPLTFCGWRCQARWYDEQARNFVKRCREECNRKEQERADEKKDKRCGCKPSR